MLLGKSQVRTKLRIKGSPSHRRPGRVIAFRDSPAEVSDQAERIVVAHAHVNVIKGWWEPLLRALEKPQAGAAGPAIADMEHPEFKGYGYCFQGPDLEMKWLPQKADTAYPVPQLGGCFIGMRRDVFKSIGGFDSGMIGWGLNDSELCMRLWGENYDLWVLPQVRSEEHTSELQSLRQ